MAENPFRILLDCRELNFKFFKFVWMSVSPRELVSIKDLKDAILKKFALERNDLQLFLRDGLLPEEENITNILRENDSVRLLYVEPSSANLNTSRTTNYGGTEQSTSNGQEKSLKKRKAHSDVSDDNEVQLNKKRISMETNLFNTNRNSENSLYAEPDVENAICADVYNFKSKKRQKSENKLENSNNSISVNECIPSNDTVVISNERVNFCKKKKKRKHSKDVSQNNYVSENNSLHDDITISEMNENEQKLTKKKKNRKHNYDTSVNVSVSETGTSYCDEIVNIVEKSDNSLNASKTNSAQLELKSSFGTTADDSEALKLAPVTFCTSFIKTPEITCSFKGSNKKDQLMSSKENVSKSFVSNNESVAEQSNMTLVQGNNCKKKRKRHRKRKPILSNLEVNESNCNDFGMSLQENETFHSGFTAASNQTADISSKNESVLDFSKTNTIASERNTNSLEVKSSFSEPFHSFLPSTSTPYSPTGMVSYSRKNASKTPNSSNTSQDRFCVTTTSRNSLTAQNRMNVNNVTTSSSPCSNVNQLTVPSYPHMKKLSTNKRTDSVSNNAVKTGLLDPNSPYNGCSPLNSCPVVGTRIAYKVLELDQSYSPVVSEYKEGIVKAVNSKSDELDIELIQPEVKEGRIGKFENLYPDESPPSEVIRKVTLDWSSLIAPLQII